jgi:hypothetical protein
VKKIIALVSIAILFIVWFMFGKSDKNDPLDVEVVAPIHSSAAVSSVAAITVNQAPLLVSKSSASKQASPSSTQSQAKPYDGWDDRLSEEAKSWFRSRGSFKEFDLQEHKRLSLDELEALANKGDLKAIEVLMQNALEAKNSARYRELADLAVTSGSISAIRLLTAQKWDDYLSSDKKNTEAILDSFAYEILAFRRGDLTSDYRLAAENFNFYPNQKQELYIEQRADEFMIEYEEKRKALGFAPFDNSPLASEKETYDRLKKYGEQQELEYREREKNYRLQQEAEGKE